MATAKTSKALQAARLEQTGKWLDSLEGNARILRDPAVWGRYHEAVHIASLLGFRVSKVNDHHEVTPC